MRIVLRLFLVTAAGLILGVATLIAQTNPQSTATTNQTLKLDAASQPRGPEPKGLIPRFGVVWQGKLTRSGRPKNDDGWKWLRGQGVNSIVNFRARNETDYKSYGFGDALWIPMDNGRLPTEAEAESFLAWIQNPENQPVNIQCAEGKDRTGMMAALARYAIDGWPLNKALDEASLYRKGEHLADERIQWLRTWAGKHKPGSHRKESSVQQSANGQK